MIKDYSKQNSNVTTYAGMRNDRITYSMLRQSTMGILQNAECGMRKVVNICRKFNADFFLRNER